MYMYMYMYMYGVQTSHEIEALFVLYRSELGLIRPQRSLDALDPSRCNSISLVKVVKIASVSLTVRIRCIHLLVSGLR